MTKSINLLRYLFILIILWLLNSFTTEAENRMSVISDTMQVLTNNSTSNEEYESFIQEYKKDTRRKLIRESLLDGKIPLGYVSLRIKDLIGYNKYEGFRTGIGIETNQWLSKRFKLGGYWRYGHHDEKEKYGANLSLLIHEKSDSWLFASYNNDIQEIGETEFLEDQSIFSSENFRRLIADQFFEYERSKAGIIHSWSKNLKSSIYWFNLKVDKPIPLYPTFIPINDINFNSLGVKIRFQMSDSSPVLFLNAERSLNKKDGTYYNTVLKVEDSFNLWRIGTSTVSILAGIAEEDGIVNFLLSPAGSFNQWFSIYSKNSFSTMRPKEFYANQMMAIFIRHNFGAIFDKTGIFNPEPSVLFASGIGNIDHKNVEYPSFEKGYFEAGLLIDNILQERMASYGINLSYRFGPYAFNSFSDNLSIQLTIKFNL